MGRFSPSVPRVSPFEVLAGGVDAVADRRDDVRFRKEEDEARALREALTRLELNRAGVREGEAPTRQVTVRDELPAFQGERPGMARSDDRMEGSIFEGAQPGMAGQSPERPPLSGALSHVAARGRPREPQMVAPAGAFIPGVGFAPRNIFDTDLAGTDIGMQRPATAERDDPRYQQLTDDFYLDTEGTPEAREARAGDARRDRMSAVLGALRESGRDAPPEVLAEALELGVPQSMMEGPEGPTINVMGREFPDTPEGREAALEWRERASAAGRGPGADGSGERITGEVTRRQFAVAAAREIGEIKDQIRDMTPYERQNLEPGQLQQAIDDALRRWGFDSIDALEEEVRTLRLSGVASPGPRQPTGSETGAGTSSPPPGAGTPAPSADSARAETGASRKPLARSDGPPTMDRPAPAVADTLSDEAIDQLILENPDLTDEELLELIERGG